MSTSCVVMVWFVCCSAPVVASAATEALWLSPENGSYASDASRWSTNPVVPANGVPTADDRYNVVFNTMSPRSYLVRMTAQDLSWRRLSIVDPMTLHQSGGTVQIDQLEIRAGSYQLSNDGVLHDTDIRVAGGLLNVADGEITNATIQGQVLLNASSPDASILRNVHFEDAVVESEGILTLGGRIDGVGVISLGERLNITEPTVIGPQVTLMVPESGVRFRDGDETLVFGKLEVRGTVDVGLRMRNYGQVTIYEGGRFNYLRLQQPDDPQPGRWLIHSGGQFSSTTQIEFGSGADLTMILGGAVNDPLISAIDFAADGVLRLRATSTYMPRTDTPIRLIGVERWINGSFREIDLGPLPTGFSWDTSNLLSTGEITFQGPPVTLVAYTEFEEPAFDVLSHVAGPGSAELGFQTVYAFNNGNQPAAGVNDIPGERALSFQSLDTTTTFDTVSVLEYANTAVDVRFSILDTAYEGDDYVELTLRSSDGAQEPLSDEISLGGIAAGVENVHRLSVDVPSHWTDVTIEVKTRTNSSSGAERVNLLGVNVVGLEYLARMEMPGDFVTDGLLDPNDLRKLDVALSRGSSLDAFDLDGNQRVDAADRLYWIESLWGHCMGDANLDGEFNSADFVAVFQLGQYEDQTADNSNWQSGDWDGDREFGSSDFVLAFQQGRYEQGRCGSLYSVPEPSGLAQSDGGPAHVVGTRRFRKKTEAPGPPDRRSRRMRPAFLHLVTLVAAITAGHGASLARADIFRWDNRKLIPETQGLVPGPAAQFEGYPLAYADLEGADLTGANFRSANLQHARLRSGVLNGANLSNANLTSADVVSASFVGAHMSACNLTDAFLQWADLTGATLTQANLTGARLQWSTFTDADLTGAIITGADLRNGTAHGLTANQLYSTANYQQQDLPAIGLTDNDLTGWDFSQQNLNHTRFSRSTLASAVFLNASIQNARLDDVTSRGFQKEQLYATASYRAGNLQGIELSRNDLANWDFSQQDLTGANLSNSNLTGANLSGATIRGVDFSNPNPGQLTEAQLRSTNSFQRGDLRDVTFKDGHLDDWDFTGQDLAGASFYAASLIGAHMGQANLPDTDFYDATMNGANLSSTNLSRSRLLYAELANANLTGADLTGAILQSAILTGAVLSNATLAWADLSETTPNGFGAAALFHGELSQQESGWDYVWIGRFIPGRRSQRLEFPRSEPPCRRFLGSVSGVGRSASGQSHERQFYGRPRHGLGPV